jgi:carboxyl-terminal processing protease|tara:strand:- start:416 stop:1660 length:1245 start_codon:yes stop_codon:yes gene_type:complete
MIKRAIIPVCFVLGMIGVWWWMWSRPIFKAQNRVVAVMRVIHEDYVDAGRVDYELLSKAAIDGMMESLDAHSSYMPATDFAHFEELTTQEYVGIGVQIDRLSDHVTVVSCFHGGPAEEAGLLPGDYFLQVNGVDVSDADVKKVSELLRGPAGESTNVTIYRPLTEEEIALTLERRVVDITSVERTALNEDSIGYVRLTQFGQHTVTELQKALDELEEGGMKGLILDLRNNPGGLLSAAEGVLAEFLGRDELIVYTEGRDEGERREFRSASPARLARYPIAILINEQSASASEIVSGALQDIGKATLIGETTFGKGSVQSIYAFKDGAGMRQTTALYYLPSGRSINETGVDPDIEVVFADEAELEFLVQERHVDLMSEEAFIERFEFTPDRIDPQLEAAYEYLREVLEMERAKRA